MSFFQCCGNQRKAIQRVDIHPPSATVKYISLDLNLKDTFESIAIRTYRCPEHRRSTGNEFFYTWEGVYIDRTKGKHGKSKLQKINLSKEPEWLGWMKDNKISEPDGSGAVMGSLSFFPFTFGQRLVK